MPRKINIVAYLGVGWAVVGLSLIFASAIVRLAPYAIEALRAGLSFGNWIALLAWCGFMLFTEGYKGFQKQFSPRFAARTLYLLNNPHPAHLLLAPLFYAGFIRTSGKRKWSVLLLSLGIVILVVGVRHVAQPWRGIIDIGVIAGLLYGLVTIYYLTIRAMITKSYAAHPEVE